MASSLKEMYFVFNSIQKVTNVVMCLSAYLSNEIKTVNSLRTEIVLFFFFNPWHIIGAQLLMDATNE